jgi:hypothetical protein
VDVFARRVASFDTQALSGFKELVNRHTVPDPKDQLESGQVFLSAFAWSGFRERAPKLAGNGLGQRGEFELKWASASPVSELERMAAEKRMGYLREQGKERRCRRTSCLISAERLGLVTGESRGIGFRTAEALGEMGCKLW